MTADERTAVLAGDGDGTPVALAGVIVPRLTDDVGEPTSRRLRGGAAVGALVVCAMWASQVATFPDRRTFLRGVQIVESGASYRLAPGESRGRREVWWEPPVASSRLLGRPAFLEQAASERS